MPPLARGDWSRLHRDLLAEISRLRLSEAASGSYAWRALYVLAAYALAWGALLCAPSWPERLVLLAGATFAVMQSGFMSHDISHHNVSRDRRISGALGQLFMSFLGGQAWAHWQWQHLGHHRHTQEALADPDLEVALFALSPADAARKRGLARWVTRFQGLLLWPAVSLQAFAIRLNSVRFLLVGRGSGADAICYALHFVLWLAVPAWVIGPAAAVVNYLLLTWFTGPCLSASFIWNHVGTRSFEATPGAAYMEQRVLGSRNLLDLPHYRLFFGGLNFHIEHHLAPHVPPSRLHEVRPLLEAALEAAGVERAPVSFLAAMGEVFGYVNAVGASVVPLNGSASAAVPAYPERTGARRPPEPSSRPPAAG